jgi:hypothetical protein
MIDTNWVFTDIHDYWNWKKDALFNKAGDIEKYDESKRNDIYESTRHAIYSLSEEFPERVLAINAFVMCEDFYRSLNRPTIRLDNSLMQYIHASCGSFCEILAKRGFAIHYLIDNAFEETEFGMTYPLQAFPLLFRGAGLVYLCPQHLAFEMITHDKKENFFDHLPQYIGKARLVASELVKKCHRDGRHYVLLDTDPDEKSFEESMNFGNTPYVVTIFRDEAPVEGSKCAVSCFDGDGNQLLKDI